MFKKLCFMLVVTFLFVSVSFSYEMANALRSNNTKIKAIKEIDKEKIIKETKKAVLKQNSETTITKKTNVIYQEYALGKRDYKQDCSKWDVLNKDKKLAITKLVKNNVMSLNEAYEYGADDAEIEFYMDILEF